MKVNLNKTIDFYARNSAKNDRRSFPLPPERAYFEPEGSELPDDEDEDELEVFQSRAASRRKQKSPEPEIDQGPPVPTRSGEPKQMMLRLMKNATNIMRS